MPGTGVAPNVQLPKGGGSGRAMFTGVMMVISGLVLFAYGTRSKRSDFDNTSTKTPSWQHRIEQQHKGVGGTRKIVNSGGDTEPRPESNTKDIPLPNNSNERENTGSWFTSFMAGNGKSQASGTQQSTARREDDKGTTYTKAPPYADSKAGKPEGYKKVPDDK
ncbi:hypothetical protein BXZ70DRAFT_1006257 [Cristinia sonorae]|uniref:Uncharacterized protein n=1 Tax=Cristinia sonorae TaxID=1940300 RepID=A0A8K0USJ0_9AGAR|nr:hypothetical protein BXZ70DRAFT_1006257 [Cristinia sonorae]